MIRRLQKIAFAGALLGVFLAVILIPAYADLSAMPRGDGVLSLYNVHLKETVTVEYRRGNGRYSDAGLEKINHLLRCRADNKETEMARDLIELVDHLQDHFGVRTVDVVSGYRTPSFNAYLKRLGRRVARHSRHMLGEAMDIRLPGVNMRTVRNYLVVLRTGGVGYYGRSRFVHVDVGPFRTW